MAIAEWADGDSIGAHFGYSNECFCTEDEAKKAGRNSVFHKENVTILKQVLGYRSFQCRNCLKPYSIAIFSSMHD